MVERNPNYWDADNVRLNKIIFYPIENAITEERMFVPAVALQRHGALDKVEGYLANNDPSLRIMPYLGTYFYRINTGVAHLQDKRVRRALGMTIDREQILAHSQIRPNPRLRHNTAGYHGLLPGERPGV